MDYKNLSIRILTSIILIFTFFILFEYLDNYFFIIIPLFYLVIFYEIYKYFKINIFYKFLIYIYIFISLIFLEIYMFYFYDKNIFLYFIFLIIIFDTSSYLFGSLFGKKKIFLNLSKGKTYFGLYLGIIFTMIISYFINNIFEVFNFLFYVFFTSTIIFLSFIGDLFESFFKRKANMKDSSKFLPGHGGFFDRFDSFLMSVIFLPIILFIYDKF